MSPAQSSSAITGSAAGIPRPAAAAVRRRRLSAAVRRAIVASSRSGERAIAEPDHALVRASRPPGCVAHPRTA